MSNNYDSKHLFDLEREIEKEIEHARSELTTVVLAKQKEIVHRMGEALEKIRKGEKRQGICEELKNRLREEIARRIISEKTIEIYCRPEWKDPQKSMWGKKGATSKNRSSSSSLPAEKLSAPLEIREEGQGDDVFCIPLSKLRTQQLENEMKQKHFPGYDSLRP